jgi:mediator of RNA polymerase II transcription subunit 6
MPDSAGKPASMMQKNDEAAMERAAEDAFMAHMRHGGEYIDENPITGRPGEFHLSSTGRKVVVPLPKKDPEGMGAMNGPAAINTKVVVKKDGKSGRTPKSASTPKLKRKKSKMSAANTPVTT